MRVARVRGAAWPVGPCPITGHFNLLSRLGQRPYYTVVRAHPVQSFQTSHNETSVIQGRCPTLHRASSSVRVAAVKERL